LTGVSSAWIRGREVSPDDPATQGRPGLLKGSNSLRRWGRRESLAPQASGPPCGPDRAVLLASSLKRSSAAGSIPVAHGASAGALRRARRGWSGIWWTRTQRIRTVARVPVEVALLDVETRPLYQQVARKAMHLSELGLSYCAIARRLEVDDKTVAKAVRWLRRMHS